MDTLITVMDFMILGVIEIGETEVFTAGIKTLFGILTKIIMPGTLVSTTLIILNLIIMDIQIHIETTTTDTIIVITEMLITEEELQVTVYTTEQSILHTLEIETQQLEGLI
jgi:hypothetical protein